jgi:hypothetical protein
MGRHSIGDRAMTDAERQRKRRAKLAEAKRDRGEVTENERTGFRDNIDVPKKIRGLMAALGAKNRRIGELEEQLKAVHANIVRPDAEIEARPDWKEIELMALYANIVRLDWELDRGEDGDEMYFRAHSGAFDLCVLESDYRVFSWYVTDADDAPEFFPDEPDGKTSSLFMAMAAAEAAVRRLVSEAAAKRAR